MSEQEGWRRVLKAFEDWIIYESTEFGPYTGYFHLVLIRVNLGKQLFVLKLCQWRKNRLCFHYSISGISRPMLRSLPKP